MKTIFFHSYKGGVGRSFILANIAIKLSEDGLNVGVLDLDYDAPGISHLLYRSLGKEYEEPEFDVMKIITEDSYFLISETVISLASKLFLLPCKPLYTEMDAVYEKVVDKNGAFGKSIEKIIQQYEVNFKLDILLVDMRPGFSFLIDTAIAMADKFVQFFRISDQDLYGTTKLGKALFTQGIPTMYIPSMIPMRIDGSINIMKERIKDAFDYELSYNSDCYIPLIPILFLDDTVIEKNKLIGKRTKEFIKINKTINSILEEIQNA